MVALDKKNEESIVVLQCCDHTLSMDPMEDLLTILIAIKFHYKKPIVDIHDFKWSHRPPNRTNSILHLRSNLTEIPSSQAKHSSFKNEFSNSNTDINLPRWFMKFLQRWSLNKSFLRMKNCPWTIFFLIQWWRQISNTHELEGITFRESLGLNLLFNRQSSIV